MTVILNNESKQTPKPDALEDLKGKTAQALVDTVTRFVITGLVPLQAVGTTLGQPTQRAVRAAIHRKIDPVNPK